MEPTSPRSVDACLRLGLEPYELKFIGQQHFQKNLRDSDLAALAFKHHETMRQVHWTLSTCLSSPCVLETRGAIDVRSVVGRGAWWTFIM